ncbi:MAG: hypothetical protein IJ497_11565 [Clostridia bacterium]|nr:hypothetical protein [Clostridia bacterium]
MNGRYFTEFLLGQGTLPVLFEPFLSKTHTETLIWRRGGHLWDTAEHVIDTLISLTDRTRSDVIVLDMASLPSHAGLEAAIDAARKTTDVGFCLLCRSRDELAIAETSADSAGLYGDLTTDKLPVIRMDGTIEDAIARGDCGYFALSGAEELLEKYGDRIRILGGLGVKEVSASAPVAIYDKVEELYRRYPGKWACGSGGEIGNGNYLELISLLGAFGRVR